MGGCQNYGPFLGPYYLGYPKRDPNFDNHPYTFFHMVSMSKPDAGCTRIYGRLSSFEAKLSVIWVVLGISAPF